MSELRITVVETPAAQIAAPLLVLKHLEGDAEPAGTAAELDARLSGALGRVLGRGDFRGKADESLVLYPRDGEIGAERILLVGAGKRESYTPERLRRTVGIAVRQAQRLGVGELAVSLDEVGRAGSPLEPYFVGRAAAEAAVLAVWEFRELKTTPDEEAGRPQPTSLILLGRDAAEADALRSGVRDGAALARGENLARELATRPANEATPTYLAQVAERIAGEAGMRVTVLDRAGSQEEGLRLFLSVAQGTDEEPRFIVLEYSGGPDGEAPLVLIGKGVTFDTGGVSIKPSANMDQMKYDLSGGAAVLGAMQAIGELRPPINVVAIVPATENHVSGRATKPGDVIRSHAGKTVEVVNTDAEGRLLLADALSYARRFQPRAIVDAATLTGAVVVSLGHHAIAVMGNDEGLIEEIRAAGDRTGERCWPLPLWDEYRPQIDSAVADLQNVGGRPAGSITAGLFLKEFADETPWAHLDIAGTAWRDDAPPYLRKGATGIPTRLLVEWVRSRAGEGAAQG